MRIVHCLREPVGGLFRHVLDLVRMQAGAGHDVGLICDAGTGGADADTALAAIEPACRLGIRRFRMSREIGPGDLVTARRVQRALSALAPHIIHAHGAKGGAYARLLPALRLVRRQAKVIYTPHGGSLHFDAASAKGRLFFAAERLFERATDALIFVCRYEQQTYATKVGEPSVPRYVVYNGIAADELVPLDAAPEAADFLYIGAMRDLKGPDLMLQALSLLRERGYAASAVMVGDGPDKARYRQMAHALALDENLRFLPPMPAREAFALGRCVVLPSRAESFPYIVLEALGARRPLIATGVGGVPEIFADATDWLVCPDSAQSLAQAMQHFLEDSSKFNALSAYLHDRASQFFTLETMAGGVESVYASLVSETPH